MVIYKRIRDLREDKDLTQKDLANYLNVSQKSYSRYERGERTIAPEILSKIATFHDTTVDYLLNRTDDKKTYKKRLNFQTLLFIISNITSII